MKAVLKQFLKVFLIAGFIFVVILSLIDGFPISLKSFVLKFLGFGGIFSMVITIIHYYSLQELGHDTSKYKNYKALQMRTVDSTKSIDEILEQIQSDSFFKKMNIIKKADSIEMKSAISWRSFGEFISIQMEPIDPTNSRFHIKSKPLLTTLVDYGKGLTNVKRLRDIIRKA